MHCPSGGSVSLGGAWSPWFVASTVRIHSIQMYVIATNHARSSCRNGWRLQTPGRSCSVTWRSRCLRYSVWRWSPALRRKRSLCRTDFSTLWSVSCLERILRRVWRNSSRAAPPPSSVDVSSKKERLSTPAGPSRSSELITTSVMAVIILKYLCLSRFEFCSDLITWQPPS